LKDEIAKGKAMVEITPRRITGQWDIGFALDFHTVSSDFLGYNQYGHPEFDTKRTALGELLYRAKNRGNKSVLGEIVTTVTDFVNSRKWRIDLVIPVPPSRQRSFQPVISIAELLAESLGIPCFSDCVRKVKDTPELKNIYGYTERMNILRDAFVVSQDKVEGKNILLFDDLFRSGATMNAVSSALKDAGRANRIYALTLTRTRRNV
jgi:competence protein ComFC